MESRKRKHEDIQTSEKSAQTTFTPAYQASTSLEELKSRIEQLECKLEQMANDLKIEKEKNLDMLDWIMEIDTKQKAKASVKKQ